MGKNAKRKQAAAMREMQALAQEQFDYYKEQQEQQQLVVDAQREQYESFEFTNPFEAAQNPFADIQTDFANVYGGVRNVFAEAENKFAGLDNLYEGMENRFEDMTVDMRAADYQTQQIQQQQANIMQGLRGAAGASGVAGLAQAMANQGALQTQQVAAGIGQQERQNQMLAAQEGARIDQLQRGAGMQLQQAQAAGAMQTQQMQMTGAGQQQQMMLAGEAQAQQLGISQQNLQAQGQWQADMAAMTGQGAVQAAEFGRESTIMGMEYGLLTGANAGLSGAMGNQMSAMGMQANMYGSQAQGSMSMWGDAAVAKAIFLCIPKGVNIDSIDRTVPIEDVKPGDMVIGYSGDPVKVLQKHEYLEDPTLERFYRVKFKSENDRIHEVNVCDMHRINGVRSKDITENVVSKEVYSGVEFSYDLLTEDLGYRIDGIPVNSMIEELAEEATKLKNK